MKKLAITAIFFCIALSASAEGYYTNANGDRCTTGTDGCVYLKCVNEKVPVGGIRG